MHPHCGALCGGCPGDGGAYAGIDLPESALTEVVTPVVAAGVAAVYYGLARFAEEYLPQRWQRVGRVMLASRHKPRYDVAA
ncbi:hypothetical protein FHX37_3863 [Haloactinospora alba]|uniref:Uncharacterized protein n=1 Tax=Haloactinospora alba TaxID=405555 RepID=A0A543N9M2_9ACTN|nr:hypothetical protein FHX37_3863 [Haloactinospora alba]